MIVGSMEQLWDSNLSVRDAEEVTFLFTSSSVSLPLKEATAKQNSKRLMKIEYIHDNASNLLSLTPGTK